MSRVITLILLALAAAAVAVPVALSATDPSGNTVPDPLAVGYLQGLGLSPSEVESWTVGACSQAVKPASCYAVLERESASQQTGASPPARQQIPIDPLAVGYLQGLGLSPSEVESWTVGACSQAVKPASCYAILDRAQRAAEAGSSGSAAPIGGFDWGDAGIGAGAAMGLVLLIAGLGAMLVTYRRHHPGPPVAH